MEGGAPKIFRFRQGELLKFCEADRGGTSKFASPPVKIPNQYPPPTPDVNSVTSLNYEDIVPRTQNNILKPPWPLFYLVCKMENVTTFLRFHRQIARYCIGYATSIARSSDT